jgi:hypothetical protein
VVVCAPGRADARAVGGGAQGRERTVPRARRRSRFPRRSPGAATCRRRCTGGRPTCRT